MAVAEILGVSVHELMTGDATTFGTSTTAKEEILLELYRGLFSHQQARLITGLRALFDANQIVRKELGQKPLRGVSDDDVRAAFGDVPASTAKKKRQAPKRDQGDAMGDFLDDLT